jgi:hypothetical protein
MPAGAISAAKDEIATVGKQKTHASASKKRMLCSLAATVLGQAANLFVLAGLL